MGAVMRQPLMAALLLVMCFPLKGVIVMLAAAAIGAAIPLPRTLSPQKTGGFARRWRRRARLGNAGRGRERHA